MPFKIYREALELIALMVFPSVTDTCLEAIVGNSEGQYTLAVPKAIKIK